MTARSLRAAAAVAAAAMIFLPSSRSEEPAMSLKKLTPVLFVEEIEPCLPFWMDRLGFQKTMEVPEGDRLGFVGLKLDGVEVMLQTRASLAKDLPKISSEGSRSFLYVEVTDLDPVRKRLEGADIAVSERKTFYGAREIGVWDPAGNVITFAAFEAEAAGKD